jgi:hypothetical protein
MLDDQLEPDYPEKGDRAFVEVDEYKKRMAVLHWIEPRVLDGMMAEAARDCAQLLTDNLCGDHLWGNPDRYFYTICFLYRHSYELLLKDILKKSISLNLITLSEFDKVKKRHELDRLWTLARPAILKIIEFEGDIENQTARLEAAGEIITDYHNIDPTGYCFRYAYDNNGNVAIDEDIRKKRVDIDVFRQSSDRLYNFLDMMNGFWSILIDQQNDNWS